MRIRDLTRSDNDSRVRVAARVEWEDCERPQRELYIEADSRIAESLWPNPNAFVLATILPAMWHGERRVLLDGPVCPELRNGLKTAMLQLRKWYGPGVPEPITIESTRGFEPPAPRSDRHVASFMSGGVDALATLYCNRADYPLEHPGAIRDGLLVHGIDVGGYEAHDRNEAHFQLAVECLSELAQGARLNLIALHTNFRHLDDSDVLFSHVSHGAIFAAIAHMLSRRIDRALLASTSHVSDMVPWGSHPLLDPNYSSADLQLRHDAARLTRLEKVRLIADQELAMRHLRCCYHPFRPGNVLNCGACEKCLRTMIELLVLGKLDRCSSFPFSQVTAEMIGTLEADPNRANGHPSERFVGAPPTLIGAVNVDHWQQLIAPLRAIGRHDLATVIDAKLVEAAAYRARAEERDVRGRLRRLDRQFLGASLHRAYQRLRGLR